MTKPKLNKEDRERVARNQADRMRAEALAEGMELAPSIIGVLQGLGTEIRELRHVSEHAIAESNERRAIDRQLLDVMRELVSELEAFREGRQLNGHSKHNGVGKHGG